MSRTPGRQRRRWNSPPGGGGWMVAPFAVRDDVPEPVSSGRDTHPERVAREVRPASAPLSVAAP